MLAERKRKTKWVLNPTKTPLWTQDSSGIKFGKELMEKMGWSAGKGLGLKEQGIEEPIRVSYKNDNKGMGFKGRDDEWIEHQDEFNLLLSRLSNNNDAAVVENSEIKKPKIKSLELKSKHSRARVHYQKFTRGKDLSSYSENDLACILGINKSKKKESKPETVMKDEGKSEYETSFGITTINSGSIEDYFKKKSSFNKIQSGSSFKSDEATENLRESLTDGKSIFLISEESNEKGNDEQKKHKKRRHKSEADSVADEATENKKEEEKCKKRKTPKSNVEADAVADEAAENESEVPKCKKRKTPKSDVEADAVADEAPTENESEELIMKVKKRKSSKSKAESPNMDETEKYEMIEMEVPEEKNDNSKRVEAKIKKKKRNNDNDGVSENKSQISEGMERARCSPKSESFPATLRETSTKLRNDGEKSKQKRHKLMLETEETAPAEEEDFRLAKEKKSKQERHKLMLETEETAPAEEEDFRLAKEKKSKKKKHKSDVEGERTNGFEVDDAATADPSSERQEKGGSESVDTLEAKLKLKRGQGSAGREMDPSHGPVDVGGSAAKVVVKSAEAEGEDRVGGEHKPYKEHHFTSERVLDLIRWADIKEFRGSNLGNVLGYGFKREYLRDKVA